MNPSPRPTWRDASLLPGTSRLALALLAATLLATGWLPARAAQVIRFKTGFEIAAKSVRYEGATVWLTLESGNEVGFPLLTIDEVISDNEVRFTPEGPSLSKVGGRFIMSGAGAWVPGGIPKSEREFMILNSGNAIAPRNGKSIPVGFSFGNEGQTFRGAPAGPISAAGKVGKGIREEGAKTHAGLAPNGQPGAGGVRIVKPVAGPGQTPE